MRRLRPQAKRTKGKRGGIQRVAEDEICTWWERLLIVTAKGFSDVSEEGNKVINYFISRGSLSLLPSASICLRTVNFRFSLPPQIWTSFAELFIKV